jgi:hypothetical protein
MGKFTKGYMKRFRPYLKLTVEAAAHWDVITKSLPADHFQAADLPLLTAYCCAAARHDKAVSELAGEIGDPALLLVVDRCIKQMTVLATKLRICVNSRITAKRAGKGAAHAVDRDPWEGFEHSPELQ